MLADSGPNWKLATMSVLTMLRHRLESHATAAGFSMVDDSIAHDTMDCCVSQLEFRTERENGSLVLGLYDVSSLQTITAELWSPKDLAVALGESVDAVAIRRQAWHYDSPADFEQLAYEIGPVIMEWVSQSSAIVHGPA